MNIIKRNEFLKMSAMLALIPLGGNLFASNGINNGILFTDDIFKRSVAANDIEVASLLQAVNTDDLKFSRRIGNNFSALAAAYCCPGSKYYHNDEIISKLDILTRFLASYQTADGTVNIANLESPPDTGFLLEYLAAAAYLLEKDSATQTKEVSKLKEVNLELKKFIIKAGGALTTGGVHTPNHRWVICAALSRINAVYPDKKYVNRIEDWLGEGVFMDSDGQYPERSCIYSGVENGAFLTIGRLLNKPALFQYPGKNLGMLYYLTEPNGDMVTTASRRQDQYMAKTIVSYYLFYRYLAIRGNNAHFAGIAKWIEGMEGFEKEILQRDLFEFMENPLLQKEMPSPSSPVINYEKLLPLTRLLRIRRDKTTSTLFGGVDWPVIIASGRSNSPNFYSYRKGNAFLKYMRLSSSFFSMGYFYSDGIKKEGNKYILYKKLEIPYYQPLPLNKRKPNGDYKLSPSIDDRFWNKMDFSNRPVSNVKKLETKITFSENGTTNELNIEVQGLVGVPVTLEFCFKEGGTLTGVTAGENGNNFLEKGTGKYEFGGDSISFGPGANAHKTITNLEGERYSTHFGTLRTEGMHVFITGITPFAHKLVIS
jgi:hypothetical protein